MVKCVDCNRWILKPEEEHKPVPSQQYRCTPDMRSMSWADMNAEQDCSRFSPKVEE